MSNKIKKLLSPMGVPMRFHWSSVFLPLLLLYIYGIHTGLLVSILFLISVIFHEYAHVWAAKYFNLEVDSVVIHPFGGMTLMRWDYDNYTPIRDVIVSVAGPIGSLVLAMFFGLLWPLNPEPIIMFAFMLNLLVGLLNLIPVKPLDGGRILNALLLMKYNYQKARKISFIMDTIIGIFGVMGFFIIGMYMISLILFIIFIFSLFSYLSEGL